MEKFTVRQGQNIFDIVLTLYGSIEGLGNFMDVNPDLTFSSSFKDGDVVNYDPAKAIDEVNVNYYAKKKIIPCNGMRSVYYNDIREPIIARVYVPNTIVSTFFTITGEGYIIVDWGDNSPIDSVTLSKGKPHVFFHEMNSNIEASRRIAIYGDVVIDELNLSGMDVLRMHLFQDIYVEKFTFKKNRHIRDVGFLQIFNSMSEVYLSESKVTSLAPLIPQERLRIIDLKNCGIKTRVLDEYFIGLVKNYQSRLKAKVYIYGNETPSGEYKAPAILSDPKTGMEAIWILEQDMDRKWQIIKEDVGEDSFENLTIKLRDNHDNAVFGQDFLIAVVIDGKTTELKYNAATGVSIPILKGSVYKIIFPERNTHLRPLPQEHTAVGGTSKTVEGMYYSEILQGKIAGDMPPSTPEAPYTMWVKTKGVTTTYTNEPVINVHVAFGDSYEFGGGEIDSYDTPEPLVFLAGQDTREATLTYYLSPPVPSRIVFDKSIADPSNITGDVNAGFFAEVLSKWRRCLCKYTASGEVTISYLKNDNSNFYEDGTAAILTGSEGDVMTYKPEFYYKYESVSSTKFAYKISNANVDGTWIHSPASLIGTYKSYQTGSKLYSRSGVAPTASQTIGVFDTQAKARGTGYQLIDYEQHCMIAFMFYAKYGNRNSQAVLGTGGATTSPVTSTGTTNARGNADTVNETVSYVNGLGIEGVFGIYYEWVSGVTTLDRVWTITNPDGTTRTSNGGGGDGWITRIAAENGAHFDMIPISVSGSNTTYYSDYYYQSSGSRMLARSCSSSSTNGGVACTNANPSDTSMYVGSRLAFRGTIKEQPNVATFKAIAIIN